MISVIVEPDATDRDPVIKGVMSAWGRTYAAGELQMTADHALIAPVGLTNRSGADAQAAWQRWHDPRSDSLFNPAQWPWYAALERARTETLAGNELPGMATNLAYVEGLLPVSTAFSPIYVTARSAFASGAEATASATFNQALPTTSTFWQRWFKRVVVVPARPTQSQITETLKQAQVDLQNGQRFAQTVRPLVIALAAHTQDASDQAQLSGEPHPHADGPPQKEDPQSHTDIFSSESVDAATLPKGLTAERAYPGYKVWTQQWDEEGSATNWLTADESEALQLLQALDQTKARQLAHRLQRRLIAARLRHWSFDQEEGRLDSRRLARLLANETHPRVFRVEAEAVVPEACVTLLVDQSASMRGTRQRMMAQTIDLAVHTLQACQIRCEVLGYTTRFGVDNPVADQWRQANSPDQPGRLNALRHIVYKTPNQPWRRTRNNLGLMLREGFGHENIDGEALHWAACRLMRQAQPRKILVVLSDGSPYDQATTQANGRSYLENNLREVIAKIERSPIHLVAIGAGQDVGRYYRHALTLSPSDAVAEVLFGQLADLLTQPV
jgi:cobaltochelatase CobT